MKLILLSQSSQLHLIDQLHQAGHAVILSTDNCEVAAPAILRNRPHAIIISGASHDPFMGKATAFVDGLPGQFRILHPEGTSVEVLKQQLTSIRRDIESHQEIATTSHQILFFDSINPSHDERSKTPPAKPEHSDLLREQDKLLVILEQARERLGAASKYRDEVKQRGAPDLRVIANRITNSRCIAAHYSRESVGRWLGVMAHFVPEMDTCYLPTTNASSHGVVWIFNGASAESQYAFECVGRLGFSEALQESIRSLFCKSFEAEEDALLVHVALALTGCGAMLELAVDAHLSALNRYLVAPNTRLADELKDEAVRQEHEILCRFWDLPLLQAYPELLVKTVSDFHRGRRSATSTTAPSFVDILASNQEA